MSLLGGGLELFCVIPPKFAERVVECTGGFETNNFQTLLHFDKGYFGRKTRTLQEVSFVSTKSSIEDVFIKSKKRFKIKTGYAC